MKSKATYFHAGCPVCVSAEESIVRALDRDRYDVEIVHLGEDGSRLGDAESQGVHSVPALVLDGQVLHINHGADLEALKS